MYSAADPAGSGQASLLFFPPQQGRIMRVLQFNYTAAARASYLRRRRGRSARGVQGVRARRPRTKKAGRGRRTAVGKNPALWHHWHRSQGQAAAKGRRVTVEERSRSLLQFLGGSVLFAKCGTMGCLGRLPFWETEALLLLGRGDNWRNMRESYTMRMHSVKFYETKNCPQSMTIGVPRRQTAQHDRRKHRRTGPGIEKRARRKQDIG